MVRTIFLCFLVSSICIFVLFSIFYGIYLGTLKIENKISLKWIIKNFADEGNFVNRLNQKLYVCLLNLSDKLYTISNKFETRCIRFSFVIAMILIIMTVLNESRSEIISLINNNTEFSNIGRVFIVIKLMILIIVIKNIKKYYVSRLRKNVKEVYYKEVIDEYLNQKDIILSILSVNMYNEESLYRILKYHNDELKKISEIYKIKILNTFDKDIFNEQYMEVELNIKRILPQLNGLKKYKFNYEEVNRFENIFKRKSRNTIIYSIDKKLCILFNTFVLESNSLNILDSERILKSFMRRNTSIDNIIENKIKMSIDERIKILRIINKIDKYIGLYVRENSRDELLKKFK